MRVPYGEPLIAESPQLGGIKQVIFRAARIYDEIGK